MENDILDALSDIGYNGPLLDPSNFCKMIDGGPKSSEYTGLVHQITEELKLLCSLEESVNATEIPDDASSFLLELSSFLKELGCPYTQLITGHMSSRLQNNEDRLLLLEYLISELMAVRMLAVNSNQASNNSMEVTIHESPTAKDLKDILIALNINKPPPNITVEQLFSKLESKLKEMIQKDGPNFVGRPIYNKAVAEKQWNELEVIHKRMCEEYKMRRDMLITRLDCTVQSFEWSGDGGKKREQIQNIYKPLRTSLKSSSALRLSDFLAARSTLLISRKTSDAAVRVNTQSQINKVMIGRVPDRGGRPSEQQPPPPEMPSWQQQRSQGSERGGRGGGSGFGGGPRVQGNWNQGQGDNRGGGRGGRGGNQNYHDNRGQSQQDVKANNQGYQDNKHQGGYQQENRNFGYSDNRSGGGGYQQNYQQANSGYQQADQGYQNQNQNYQTQAQGYQNYQSQGYQQQQNYTNQGHQAQGGYRQNSGYQSENQGYQNQGKGRYQNEHDDRTNNFNNRGRGRSNYNRGGRN